MEKEIVFNVYPRHIQWQYDNKGGGVYAFIDFLMGMAEENTGHVYFTAEHKQAFLNRTGMSRAGMYKVISYLRDVEAILPIVRNGKEVLDELYINPLMFWRGDEKSRQKLIKTLGLSA